MQILTELLMIEESSGPRGNRTIVDCRKQGEKILQHDLQYELDAMS